MKKTISKIKIFLITATAIIFSATNSIAHFGSKGPFGGTVNCAIVNDTVVYVGTLTGGVYQSANTLLAAWTPRPVGLKSGKINALTHTGSYLFAASDSGVYRFTGFVGNDRYWEKVNAGLDTISVISLCSIDSITILAGTMGDGVYKSSDKGLTWTAVNTNLHHFDVKGFANAGSRIIQVCDGGLWSSDDNALTWDEFNDANTEHIDATAISYNTLTDEILINNTGGLFLLASASTTGVPSYVASQTGLPSGIQIRSISNNGSKWFLATNQGVFSSTTGSITWTSESTGLTTQDITAIVPYPNQNRLVVGTNNEGLFKTPDSLVNWTKVATGFNNLVTYSLATKDTVLIVAATERGVFVSNNLATSYRTANTGLTDSLHVNDVTFFGNTLVAATENDGVFMSHDTGSTWMTMNMSLSNLSIKKIIASSDYIYIIDSSNEIYRSDMMTGWVSVQAGLPSGVVPTSMIFYQGIILLGTYGDGIYTRNESSGVWTQFNNGLSNLNVTSVSLNDQNKVFAGTDGNGVFVSDATTINWSATSSISNSFIALMGLDVTRIQSMGFYAGYVFASIRGSVVASSDNGVTWEEAGTQFNVPSYADLNKLSFVTTRIFTSTPNNSLYSQGLSELPVIPVGLYGPDKNYATIQIAPNPSAGKIKLEFKNENENILEINIFDEAGRIIKQFNKISKNEIELNVAEGVYFMRIITNNGVQTQKIIIQ